MIKKWAIKNPIGNLHNNVHWSTCCRPQSKGRCTILSSRILLPWLRKHGPKLPKTNEWRVDVDHLPTNKTGEWTTAKRSLLTWTTVNRDTACMSCTCNVYLQIQVMKKGVIGPLSGDTFTDTTEILPHLYKYPMTLNLQTEKMSKIILFGAQSI